MNSGGPGTGVPPAISGVDQLRRISGGANGTVWAGREVDLDRNVAVKVLRIIDDDARRRFERERRAMGRLTSIDGIAPILRTGMTPRSEPFIVMPLYPRSLRDLLDARGPLPWRNAVDMMRRIAIAASHTHHLGILHLDLKPSNILLNDSNDPYIADFGIAEILDAGGTAAAAMLTPSYSAPERFENDPPTIAADVYGLGATLFAMLTGVPPFRTNGSASPAVLMHRIMNDPVDLGALPADLPPRVRTAIRTALAKRPADRHSSAEQFALAITGSDAPSVSAVPVPGPASGSGSQRQVVSAPMQPPEAARGRSWVPAVLVLGVLLAIGAGVGARLLTGGSDPEVRTEETDRARSESSEDEDVSQNDPSDDEIDEPATVDSGGSVDEESPAPTDETEEPLSADDRTSDAGTATTTSAINRLGAEADLRFDVGALTAVTATTISFDRYQIMVGDQWLSGPDIATRPIIGGWTEDPFRNENPQIRDYVLSPDARALALDPTWVAGRSLCGSGAAAEPEPQYVAATLGTLIGSDVVIAFDDDGQVTTVFDASGCPPELRQLVDDRTSDVANLGVRCPTGHELVFGLYDTGLSVELCGRGIALTYVGWQSTAGGIELPACQVSAGLWIAENGATSYAVSSSGTALGSVVTIESNSSISTLTGTGVAGSIDFVPAFGC